MNNNMILYYDLDFTRHQLSDIILQYLTQILKVQLVHDLLSIEKQQYEDVKPIIKIDFDMLHLILHL